MLLAPMGALPVQCKLMVLVLGLAAVARRCFSWAMLLYLATAVFASADGQSAGQDIDVAKDSPADRASRELQALGLNQYADPAASTSDPAAGANEAAAPDAVAAATEDRRRQLQAEIQERNNTLRTYAEKIRPFVSQGWFTDITSDLNGTALHRLQVFCWTITLGLVFLFSVYRELAMPDFNSTLLRLMGISSAGYLGFKIPELNN